MQYVVKYNTSTVEHKYTRDEKDDENGKPEHNLHTPAQQEKPATRRKQV